MLSDRCPLSPVCMSVYNVGVCGQTVGWIKIKYVTEVGLAPGHTQHTVLDWDPAPPPQRATASNFQPRRCGLMSNYVDHLLSFLSF